MVAITDAHEDEHEELLETAAVTWHAATIVRAIKRSTEPGTTHVLHFDDGEWEKVGLPDSTIQLTEAPVATHCVCPRCRLTDAAGRALPLKHVG